MGLLALRIPLDLELKAENQLQRPKAIPLSTSRDTIRACTQPETPLHLQGLIPGHLPEAAMVNRNRPAGTGLPNV